MPSPGRLRGRGSGVCCPPRSKLIALVLAVVAVALMAGIAVAASTTVGSGKVKVNGKSKTVVVNTQGVTLYTLSGERVGNLKCESSTCFGLWPPYKVSATARLTKAKGVKGALSKLQRVKGKFFQVMLDGHPLYRFASDNNKKGSALGEGFKSFGGTWHVVAAS